MDDFHSENYVREKLSQDFSVSRETWERLKIYHDLLLKWQKTINLISPSTIHEIWHRHILDSAQLYPLLCHRPPTLLDIGSGAGFPGLILAILGVKNTVLVESDHKKCAFLQEAARLTGTSVTIHSRRIESLPSHCFSNITARACAPLHQLFSWASPFFQKNTICLFLKGKNCTKELEEAGQFWSFSYQQHPSLTDSSGVILAIETLVKKE